MLVLSRYVGETVEVVIGGVVVATVMVVEGGMKKVRLGFNGEKRVEFYRTELLEEVRKNGRTKKGGGGAEDGGGGPRLEGSGG